MQTKFLIIGAGLTGLSAAYHLNDNYLLFEASDSPGGTASTFNYKGFKLDNGVHVLYFRKKEILNWLRTELRVELIEQDRKCSVWINDSFIDFPIQYNLNSLPLIKRFHSAKSILNSIISQRISATDSLEDFSHKTFGSYLTDAFVRPYNEKLFGVKLDKLNIDWFGDYIPTYSKVKMLLSAAGYSNNRHGRNSKFVYPLNGGISQIANKISAALKIAPTFNTELVNVSLKKKRAVFNDGSEVKFDYLINTIPLKSLLNKFDNIPAEISECAAKLKQNSTTILHILCKGALEENDNHWIYIPDYSIPFYRITLPGNINPANCPYRHFAITLEMGGTPIVDDALLNSCISALGKMNILNKYVSEIDYKWSVLDCGYVIYDEQRKIALNKISTFLLSNSIWSIGRYGNWEYSNMEDALLHGKNTSEKLMQLN